MNPWIKSSSARSTNSPAQEWTLFEGAWTVATAMGSAAIVSRGAIAASAS